MLPKIFETIMVVCFGAAWPMSIVKSLKSRTAKGKSLFFLVIILVGYAAGMTKVCLSDGWYSFMIIPYALNFFMVAFDTMLYFRNRKLDMLQEKGTTI